MDIASIETSRLEQQVLLDSRKPPAERNRLGQFATPPELALQIACYARTLWDRRDDLVRFIDPAIGTGSFYAALSQAFPPDQIADAAGIEIDPDFARAAQSLWRSTGLHVARDDFTRKPPPSGTRFNLVLTNPPYVRHHHISAEDKAYLQGRAKRMLGIEISRLAGLYAHFLLLAHEWMEDDGIGIWLIPSEFMNVNYGAALRDYLTCHVRLLHIHRFCPSDVQFCDALVTSTVVVFQKSRPSPDHEARFTFGGSLQAPELDESVPLATLRGLTKWTSFPHRPGNGSRTSPDHATLGQLFSIKRGIATGSNRFFILSRSEAHSNGIPDTVIRPILPSPRHLPELVIERAADGWPATPDPLALIDTTLDEGTICRDYPGFWSYLRSGIKQNVHEGYLASRREPWYSQERRDPAPFLCTYMGRARNGSQPFRFIWNKSHATAANVYLLLYPRGRLKALLAEHPDLAAAVFEGLSEIEPDNFIAEGRVYGGGLHKVEPKELAALSGQPIIDRIEGLSAPSQLELFFTDTF